jgi:hypothetical protein
MLMIFFMEENGFGAFSHGENGSVAFPIERIALGHYETY